MSDPQSGANANPDPKRERPITDELICLKQASNILSSSRTTLTTARWTSGR